MPAPTWPEIVQEKIKPNLDFKRASVTLTHAEILALTTPLELQPGDAGLAYVRQRIAVSHPGWIAPYVGARNGLIVADGVTDVEVTSNVLLDEAVVLMMGEWEPDTDIDCTDDLGLPLTVQIILPSGDVRNATISGTAPAGPGSTGGAGGSTNGVGGGASFALSWSGGVYTIDSITNGGAGYAVNDEIYIDGGNLDGGSTPANNVTITVTEVGDGTLSGGHPNNELKISVDYTEYSI